jgi:hypothetical protein
MVYFGWVTRSNLIFGLGFLDPLFYKVLVGIHQVYDPIVENHNRKIFFSCKFLWPILAM